MKISDLEQNIQMSQFSGIAPVTQKMIQIRATELALINGRASHDISLFDWEQANRELRGEPEMDPKEAFLESAPEAERWDPLPGSEGHQSPIAMSDDQDSEGRSMSERLVEEGVLKAEHDQMIKSIRNETTSSN